MLASAVSVPLENLISHDFPCELLSVKNKTWLHLVVSRLDFSICLLLLHHVHLHIFSCVCRGGIARQIDLHLGEICLC